MTIGEIQNIFGHFKYKTNNNFRQKEKIRRGYIIKIHPRNSKPQVSHPRGDHSKHDQK